MPDTQCGNILVRGVNWVGDAVMTMPALKAIRKALPGKKITLLVKPWVSPLFEKDPNVDEIIPYGVEYKGIVGKYRLSRYLKSRKFSLAILLQNAFDAAFIAWLAGIPERVGYNRDARGFLLTRPIPYDKEEKKMHHIYDYLELLRRFGLDAGYSEPWIYLDLKERLSARETLKDMKRPVVGINPGATYGSSKRWQPDRFAAVIGRIIRELDGSAVIFGGGAETAISDEIVSGISIRERVNNMAGKTSLRELSALIAECDVLVSNDSGPMHIGYAVKTPLVAIFGSTTPFRTGPCGKGDIVIKKDVDCGPCFERECKKADLKCMDSITVEEVFDAVRKLIPKNRAVFFDRDGTLCRDAGYLSNWNDFKVFPEIKELGRLKDNGFELIGVTNQSGVARGIIKEEFVKEVNDLFVRQYGFDGFYYCPHHPDEHCACRKPEPEMPLTARVEFSIDFKRSYVVGDKEADMLLAKAIGAKSIMVLTGQVADKEGRPPAKGVGDPRLIDPDFIARDLKDAVEWILKDIKQGGEKGG